MSKSSIEKVINLWSITSIVLSLIKYDTTAIIEAERIQRMPVRHIDRYGGSTKHSPSFKDIEDGITRLNVYTRWFLDDYRTNEDVNDNNKHTCQLILRMDRLCFLALTIRARKRIKDSVSYHSMMI